MLPIIIMSTYYKTRITSAIFKIYYIHIKFMYISHCYNIKLCIYIIYLLMCVSKFNRIKIDKIILYF